MTVIGINELRMLVQNVAANATLLVAADVYAKLTTDHTLEEAVIDAGSRGVTIRLAPSVAPGAVIVMSRANIQAPQRWANQFLSKSGPAKPGSVVAYSMGAQGPSVPPSPKPPSSPRPPKPPTPPAPPMRPKVRQRIVDT